VKVNVVEIGSESTTIEKLRFLRGTLRQGTLRFVPRLLLLSNLDPFWEED